MAEVNNILWKKKLRDLEESSSDESEKERRKVKKLKKLLKKEKRKTEKLLKKKLKYDKKLKEKSDKRKNVVKNESKKLTVKSEKAVLGASEAGNSSADVPLGLMERSKAMAPMTKEEWDKRQSIVRRVLDEESGRYRLIKGDGEVLEEIVSYDRHKEINQKATRADGAFFQSQTVEKNRK